MLTTAAAHVLLYPFYSSGHIIPILDLATKLLSRGLEVTVLVTPSNLPLLDSLLSKYPSSFQSLVLPLPESGLVSANNLLFKLRAMTGLSDDIIQWFHSHPNPPVAIVSDFFLGWTHKIACQLGVSHIVFSPSGVLGLSVGYAVWRDRPKNDEPENHDFMVSFPSIPNSPSYPWWQISVLYRNLEDGDPDKEFFRNGMLDNIASWGLVVNTFTELERVYIEAMKKLMGHNRVWAVGPLLPAPEDDDAKRGGSSAVPSHKVLSWLDQCENDSVVYICFGSRTSLPNQQMVVLAAALEASGVNFIWCVRQQGKGDVASESGVIPEGFEDRVGNRGFVIRGWAPQVRILRHRAVGAFLTHCGWNSTLEGLAAGLVMLTWPMGADQYTNANLLVNEVGVGIRVAEETRRVPDSTELARILSEAVDGSRPEKVRAMELRDAALSAANGGSSDRDLDDLVERLKELKCEKGTNGHVQGHPISGSTVH